MQKQQQKRPRVPGSGRKAGPPGSKRVKMGITVRPEVRTYLFLTMTAQERRNFIDLALETHIKQSLQL